MISIIAFLLLVISQCNMQKQCPVGQYIEVDKCLICGVCYDIWMDKIKPFKSATIINISSLEKDISDIENRLLNNKARLAMLEKSKTELISQIKYLQSIGNNLSKNDASTVINKWREKINLNVEKIRLLQKDKLLLKRESEINPAKDNIGYLDQINKANVDYLDAIQRAKLALTHIIDAVNKCAVLVDEGIIETLKNRTMEEQDILSKLRKQIEDSFSLTPTEILCTNSLCALKSTCRVCNDLKKCYSNDMLKIMMDVVKSKFDIMERDADRVKSSIPLLEYEAKQSENPKQLITDVVNKTKASEKHIVNRIKKFLSNFSPGDVDIYKTISQLKLNNKEIDIKKLAIDLNFIIDEWMKLYSDDISDLKDKSKKLLSSSEIVKNNLKYISEAIRIVKDILRGKDNDQTDGQIHIIKDFLIQLSEILDEIDRRYSQILKKRTNVESKLSNLEELNSSVDKIIGELLHVSHKATQESIDINIKVDRVLMELRSALDIFADIEKRTKSIDKFWIRMIGLLDRSDDLVEKILKFDYERGNHVEFLETNIRESLKETDTIIETARNKSIVYEKCA